MIQHCFHHLEVLPCGTLVSSFPSHTIYGTINFNDILGTLVSLLLYLIHLTISFIYLSDPIFQWWCFFIGQWILISVDYKITLVLKDYDLASDECVITIVYLYAMHMCRLKQINDAYLILNSHWLVQCCFLNPYYVLVYVETGFKTFQHVMFHINFKYFADEGK